MVTIAEAQIDAGFGIMVAQQCGLLVISLSEQVGFAPNLDSNFGFGRQFHSWALPQTA